MRWFQRKAKPSRRVAIREASGKDLDTIVHMLDALVADKVPRRSRKRYLQTVRREQSQLLIDPSALWLIAERSGEPVGCARATLHHEHPLLAYLPDRDYGYIYGVFVTADERRTGTGRQLLQKCEQWLRAKGARWVFLHSTFEAIPFYEAVGYEPSLEFGKRL